VPPESAFNKNPQYFEASLEDLAALDEEYFEEGLGVLYKDRKARLKQGGIGSFTLCPKCNNAMGRWYGSAYMDWAYQAMGVLLKANGRPSLYYPMHFFPLRVIKQVFAMFFSLNDDVFHKNEPELQRFLLNKHDRFLSSRYQVYAYYNLEGSQRYIGGSIIGDIGSGSWKVSYVSELCFPPFGFVLTLGSPPPDSRLTNISHFAQYQYNDWIDYNQRFPVLPTYLPHIPGDYRTKKEILNAIASNRAKGEALAMAKLETK